MARLGPAQLLDQLARACDSSDILAAYTVWSIDLDILSVRVYLTDGSFTDAFYNTATGKTAFAHVVGEERAYGKDNARVAWHVHPYDDPADHRPCEPAAFGAFLAEVESHGHDSG